MFIFFALCFFGPTAETERYVIARLIVADTRQQNAGRPRLEGENHAVMSFLARASSTMLSGSLSARALGGDADKPINSVGFCALAAARAEEAAAIAAREAEVAAVAWSKVKAASSTSSVPTATASATSAPSCSTSGHAAGATSGQSAAASNQQLLLRLGERLVKKNMRAVDWLRSWDTNGDGVLQRTEVHEHILALCSVTPSRTPTPHYRRHTNPTCDVLLEPPPYQKLQPHTVSNPHLHRRRWRRWMLSSTNWTRTVTARSS